MTFKHAKLSPSSALRWAKCPGSLTYDSFPSKESAYSQEGTLAHEAAEKALHDEPIEGGEYTDEMISGAQVYKKAINDFWQSKGITPIFETEKTVELHAITNEVAQGKIDYIGFSENTILIADYKFGMDKVDVVDNLQLWLYMAAYVTSKQKERQSFKDHTFACMIVQPRINNIEMQIKNYKELAEITKFLSLAAKRASIEEKLPEEYRTFCPSKKTCQYCKGSGQCKAEAEANLNYTGIRERFDNNTLENSDLSRVYAHLGDVKKYLENVESLVRDKMTAGESIPGFKLIQGRHLPKRWMDEESAVSFLRSQKLEDSQIYVSKLISPTQAEKLCNKEEYKQFALSNVESPLGNPIIAPESDKHPAILTTPTTKVVGFCTNQTIV